MLTRVDIIDGLELQNLKDALFGAALDESFLLNIQGKGFRRVAVRSAERLEFASGAHPDKWRVEGYIRNHAHDRRAESGREFRAEYSTTTRTGWLEYTDPTDALPGNVP